MIRALLALSVAAATLTGCATHTPAPGSETPAAATPAPAAADPVALTIPSLQLTAPIDHTGLNPDGTIQVPSLDHVERAAWVDTGPHPGQVGHALIIGHINGNGHPGVFADLATIDIGADITITDTDGNDQHFTVTATGQAPKTAFPTGRVYGDIDKPELVLVTCGGELDEAAHSYKANTIVFADPAGSPR